MFKFLCYLLISVEFELVFLPVNDNLKCHLLIMLIGTLKIQYEPCHEIMVLFVLRKLNSSNASTSICANSEGSGEKYFLT